jgi:protein MpaA
VLGASRKGRPLTCIRFGGGADRILILGGFHGDEPQSAAVVSRLANLLAARPSLLKEREVILLAEVNPDGLARRHRKNAAGVDLNRNFPASNWRPSHHRGRYHGGPAPASEPETAAVVALVEDFRPHRIITVHAISRGRECNNYDGPGDGLADAMSRCNGYPVRSTIGYPTPGSFGAWAGVDRGIPTVTLELPARAPANRGWHENRGALLAAIRFDSDRATARAPQQA